MKPPTAEELVGPEPRGLDEESVLSLFLGKSRDDARKMFSTVPCTEEFVYMAPIGFLYYIVPAFEYLRSEASRGNWEFAHGLLCSLSCRVSLEGVDDTELSVIRQVADYSEANRSKWNDGIVEDPFDEYLGRIRLK